MPFDITPRSFLGASGSGSTGTRAPGSAPRHEVAGRHVPDTRTDHLLAGAVVDRATQSLSESGGPRLDTTRATTTPCTPSHGRITSSTSTP